MYKKILSGVLAVALLFGSAAALPAGVFEISSNITASAASTATSGKCGENVYWSLKKGVLTISGKGKMTDYFGDSPFYNRTDIKSVVVKSGVTSIGDQVFWGCSNLSSITIPSSVTNIGRYAFYKCSKIISITIPSSVKNIEGNAFNNCTSLKSVTIPDSVKSIGADAFSYCSELKTVSIGNGVSSIGYFAFQGCVSLTNLKIGKNVNDIGQYAFYGCTSLTSVEIPGSVTNIGSYAFSACTSLTSAMILATGNIDTNAFRDCTKLKKVYLTDGNKSIGNGAFFRCPALKSITIPKSTVEIGDEAFGNNLGLIRGFKGSQAQTYAKKNGFKFVEIELPKQSRFAGANRYDTAALISKGMYSKGTDTVIVATGLDFHDALVAVPLANAYNAPLLLTTDKQVTKQTEAELARLKAKNVIIVSTNGAVGSAVKTALAKYNPTLISGKTCFETASNVAKALQTKTKKAPDTIFFATDSAFADALSASPIAAVKNAPIIYLKNTGSIDSATANYLKSVKGKVKNAYIIGGDGVISDAMMNKVATALGLTVNKTVVRVAGKNRYETCVNVNKKFKSVLSSNSICVAKGLDFPDALAGGVYAAKNGQALFLADGKKLQDFQSTYLKSKNASKLTIFGGLGAVPDSLVKLIAEASV